VPVYIYIYIPVPVYIYIICVCVLMPWLRPALDADSFFNKDDLTIEEAAARGGEEETAAGNHVARKSSLGAIWEYLLQANGKGAWVLCQSSVGGGGYPYKGGVTREAQAECGKAEEECN
jgi:hypothetical protein